MARFAHKKWPLPLRERPVPQHPLKLIQHLTHNPITSPLAILYKGASRPLRGWTTSTLDKSESRTFLTYQDVNGKKDAIHVFFNMIDCFLLLFYLDFYSLNRHNLIVYGENSREISPYCARNNQEKSFLLALTNT